jgi:hypothetical protein
MNNLIKTLIICTVLLVASTASAWRNGTGIDFDLNWVDKCAPDSLINGVIIAKYKNNVYEILNFTPYMGQGWVPDDQHSMLITTRTMFRTKGKFQMCATKVTKTVKTMNDGLEGEQTVDFYTEISILPNLSSFMKTGKEAVDAELPRAVSKRKPIAKKAVKRGKK